MLKIIGILSQIRKEIISGFEYFFIINIPGRVGYALRRLYWSSRFQESSSFILAQGCRITSPGSIIMGNGVNIMHNCCLYAHNNGILKIGDHVNINTNVFLGAADNGVIIIGNDVAIGPNVVIRASNHKYLQKDFPVRMQGHTGGKIIIEEDVWIGANAVILPDITIGKGSVIGAGAVVNSDIPPYSLAGGVPARIIKENCRV